ncbi:MAG: hypothetical protein AABW48_00785 [Nanoarchaeota archaeon]
MTILEDLLEFEKPLSEGVRLQTEIEPKKSFWDKFRKRPTERRHYKYHRTKAGLYVVLPHNSDGSLDLQANQPKGSCSSSVFGISLALPENFYLSMWNAVTWDYSTNNFKLISEVPHYSGVSAIHTLNSQGSIVSLELTSPVHPTWPIQRDPQTSWSLEVHRDQGASGVVHSHEAYKFLPDGKINVTETLNLKQKLIDYEQSFNNVIKLLSDWNIQQTAYQEAVFEPNYSDNERKKLHDELYLGILQSSDCLVFK